MPQAVPNQVAARRFPKGDRDNLSVAAATSPLSGETRGEAAGWISVEDRLPEAYETVLFTGVNKYGNRYRTQRGYYCGGDVWYSEIVPGKKVVNGVTHWMPLPEPPEVKA